jgi:hypothetical protein
MLADLVTVGANVNSVILAKVLSVLREIVAADDLSAGLGCVCLRVFMCKEDDSHKTMT